MERIHKLKGDYGIGDYYKYYKKKYDHDDTISRQTYNKILTDFNAGIIDLVIEQHLIFYIPFLGLEIFIKKDKRKPKIVNGKLVNNVPINWKATTDLWGRDEEAKEKKVLVRYSNSHTSGYVFRIYCKKFKSRIRQKRLYKFKPSRKFQRALSARILDPNKDNFDAFLLYK